MDVQSSSMNSRTLDFSSSSIQTPCPRVPPLPLDLCLEPAQRVLGGDQLAPGLVQAALLALHEAAVRRDGLVDPIGGLADLEMDLPGESVAEPIPDLRYPALKIALGLAPLARHDPETTYRQRRGQQQAGDVGGGPGDHGGHQGA